MKIQDIYRTSVCLHKIFQERSGLCCVSVFLPDVLDILENFNILRNDNQLYKNFVYAVHIVPKIIPAWPVGSYNWQKNALIINNEYALTLLKCHLLSLRSFYFSLCGAMCKTCTFSLCLYGCPMVFCAHSPKTCTQINLATLSSNPVHSSADHKPW